MEFIIGNIVTSLCFGFAAAIVSKDSRVGFLVGFGVTILLTCLLYIVKTYGIQH